MNKYRAKSLIAGDKVDPKFKGMTLVATPNGTDHTQMVTFAHEYMVIPKRSRPLCVRTFEDKYGRNKKYHLFYFKWVPVTPKAVREVSVMEAIQNSGMTLDRLRSMRPKNL